MLSRLSAFPNARSTPDCERKFWMVEEGAPVKMTMMPWKPHIRSSALSKEPRMGGLALSLMFSSISTTSACTGSPSVYDRSGLRTPMATSMKASCS
eukprot:scaffold11320_cov121-Isochrysis_galbana.AAC.5